MSAFLHSTFGAFTVAGVIVAAGWFGLAMLNHFFPRKKP